MVGSHRSCLLNRLSRSSIPVAGLIASLYDRSIGISFLWLVIYLEASDAVSFLLLWLATAHSKLVEPAVTWLNTVNYFHGTYGLESSNQSTNLPISPHRSCLLG